MDFGGLPYICTILSALLSLCSGFSKELSIIGHPSCTVVAKTVSQCTEGKLNNQLLPRSLCVYIYNL